MRDYLGYEIVKISNAVSEDKFKKAVRSGKITLNKDELNGAKPWLVHPMCAKLIKKAQDKGRGVTSMLISASDILYDMKLHDSKSVWNFMHDMKKKKAYNWVWADAEEAK